MVSLAHEARGRRIHTKKEAIVYKVVKVGFSYEPIRRDF